jgi:hypothetical protein
MSGTVALPRWQGDRLVELLYSVWKLPFHQTPQALNSVFQTTGCHGAQKGGGGAGGAHMGTTASCGIGPPCPGGGRKSRPGGAGLPGAATFAPGPSSGAGIGHGGGVGNGGSACANPAPNPAAAMLIAPTRVALAAVRFNFIYVTPSIGTSTTCADALVRT